LWGIDSTNEIYKFQTNSTPTSDLSPLTSTSSSSFSPTSSTTNINQGNPTGVIIGLSVGFGLVIILSGVAILFIIRHYKKSKLPEVHSDLSEVVRQ
jgi:hypothetical protein